MRTFIILAVALLFPCAMYCQTASPSAMNEQSSLSVSQNICSSPTAWLDVTPTMLNSVDVLNVSVNKMLSSRLSGATSLGFIPGISLQVKNTSAYSADAVKVVVWYDIDVRQGRMVTTARRSMETIVFGTFAPNSVSNVEYGYFLRSLPLSARIVESGVSGVYQKARQIEKL